MVQLSHPYMTPGKTTALTRQTFVGRVMSLVPELNTHPSWSQEADGTAGEDGAFADPALAPSQPLVAAQVPAQTAEHRHTTVVAPSPLPFKYHKKMPPVASLTGNLWGVNSGTYNPAPALLMYHQPTTLLPQP